MSDELKQEIQDLVYYYGQHDIERMIEVRPNFVADDFKKLLEKLKQALELN